MGGGFQKKRRNRMKRKDRDTKDYKDNRGTRNRDYVMTVRSRMRMIRFCFTRFLFPHTSWKVTNDGHYCMEAYYALQGIHNTRWNENGELVPCMTDAEKETERLQWRATATETLPASFRISQDVPECLRVQLEEEMNDLLKAAVDAADAAKVAGKEEGAELPSDIVRQLAFLPHAYQLQMDRKLIRRNQHLEKLHEWLKQQTSAGFITRQETVSMIPPVVLDPQPDDRVLDMCSAPGSKTSQLLERLGEGGRIVANDNSAHRAL